MTKARFLIGLGIYLRLWRLWHGDAWHDEAFTGLVAPLPWPRFWEALLGDVHPPLWYLVERVSLALLPHGEISLRLPAALCAVGSLLLFYRLLERCQLPAGPQLAALALMAFSPFQIYYAQEGRMYAAVELAALAMLLGVLERRPWFFAAGAAAALWLHNLGAVYVLAGVLALLVSAAVRRERLPISWVRAAIAVALAGVPALIWTGYQAVQVNAAGYWILDKGIGAWLYNALYCQLLGQGLIDGRLSWNAVPVALVLALAGLGMGIRGRRWEMLIMGWVPGLAMLLISNTVRPMLLSRTLIGTAPALYLLAGQLFNTRRRQLVLGLALIPLLFSGLQAHYFTSRRGGDVGVLTQAVAAERPVVVMHSQTGSYVVMAWHMPRQKHVLWAGASRGLSNALSDRTVRALQLQRVSLAELERPAAVIYADYALVSPDERASLLAELSAAGADLVAVLADDNTQRIDLWMLR